MRIRRVLPIVVLSVVLAWLVAPAPPAGSLQIPAVPHAVDELEDCLACHDSGQVVAFPDDHAGRENDSCLLCHEVQPEGVPPVPHTLDGRDDCVACHGADGVVPFPESHAGLESDSCLSCHPAGVDVSEPEPEATAEPTATLPPAIEALPTPIQEPEIFGENTCITCHLELGGRHTAITDDWSESIHAERGVGCVSCHGGDPTASTAEESMSPEAGYLGPLPKERIPGLCASCHSRVELMRQFDLPTDQFDQYWQSQHGQALLEGDENVATCFDCHDGHRTLATNDPASLVYPRNEPAMCAGCHSNETLMAPYDIPTNQYDLYVDSVHGMALLEEQDMRAPACSTCHGTHGAAPPGFQEVANVCGQCHGATEDYYLEGGHRMGMTSEALPRCVTCHGRYDVPPATIDLFLGTEERHCGSCHPPGSERAEEVQAIYEALLAAREAYDEAAVTIEEATERRLIMAEEEEFLQQARTPLIEARAMQHTVDVAFVQENANESMEISALALAGAEAALEDLQTRWVGMVVALVVILITVVALALIKRQLDRELEVRRARDTSQS
jgi:hypothetical protein